MKTSGWKKYVKAKATVGKKCKTHKNEEGFDLFSGRICREWEWEVKCVALASKHSHTVHSTTHTSWLERCKFGCCGKIQIYDILLESKSSTQTSFCCCCRCSVVDNTFKFTSLSNTVQHRRKISMKCWVVRSLWCRVKRNLVYAWVLDVCACVLCEYMWSTTFLHIWMRITI